MDEVKHIAVVGADKPSTIERLRVGIIIDTVHQKEVDALHISGMGGKTFCEPASFPQIITGMAEDKSNIMRPADAIPVLGPKKGYLKSFSVMRDIAAIATSGAFIHSTEPKEDASDFMNVIEKERGLMIIEDSVKMQITMPKVSYSGPYMSGQQARRDRRKNERKKKR